MIYPSKKEAIELTAFVVGAGLLLGSIFSLIDFACTQVVKLI